jgi:ferredoxin-2, mitochondrial
MPALVSMPPRRRRGFDVVKVCFVNTDGERKTIEAEPGGRLLEVAQGAGMPLEGTCEGQMACSTCHVIVASPWFDSLSQPSADEEDMLDLAAGVTRQSRLSCQIELTEALDGIEIHIPKVARDMQIV